MIDALIFFGVGTIGLYLVSRYMRREFIEGRCMSCPYNCKDLKTADCLEQEDE